MRRDEPPAFGRPVTVQYLKYGNAPHWRHEAIWLGRDEHGTWLGAPAGSIVQRGTEPAIQWPAPYVQLIPDSGWFTLIGNPAESRYMLYIDIIAGRRWTEPDRVEMIDVDLDIVRDADGAVHVLDEDEFAEHQRKLGYPQWLVDRARATAAEIVVATELGQEPFGNLYQTWLGRLAQFAPAAGSRHRRPDF